MALDTQRCFAGGLALAHRSESRRVRVMAFYTAHTFLEMLAVLPFAPVKPRVAVTARAHIGARVNGHVTFRVVGGDGRMACFAGNALGFG